MALRTCICIFFGWISNSHQRLAIKTPTHYLCIHYQIEIWTGSHLTWVHHTHLTNLILSLSARGRGLSTETSESSSSSSSIFTWCGRVDLMMLVCFSGVVVFTALGRSLLDEFFALGRCVEMVLAGLCCLDVTLTLCFCDLGWFSPSLSRLNESCRTHTLFGFLSDETLHPACEELRGSDVRHCWSFGFEDGLLILVCVFGHRGTLESTDGFESDPLGFRVFCTASIDARDFTSLFTMTRSLRDLSTASRWPELADVRSVLLLRDGWDGDAMKDEESQSILLSCSWPIRAETEFWAGEAGISGGLHCVGFMMTSLMGFCPDVLHESECSESAVCKDIWAKRSDTMSWDSLGFSVFAFGLFSETHKQT